MNWLWKQVYKALDMSPPMPPTDFRPSKAQKRNFLAATQTQIQGWDTQSYSVDYWLKYQLGPMRARSRDLARNNPYAIKFGSILRTNIVGPVGIKVQSQAAEDDVAVDQIRADIEGAYADWGEDHFDLLGELSRDEFERMAVETCAHDGEFLAVEHYTGKYNLQYEVIDPELLDRDRNQSERGGNVTRLGVERSAGGRGPVVAYWFKDLDLYGHYQTNKTAQRVSADRVIHLLQRRWPNQSRGIPWAAAVIVAAKMIDGYDDAALTAARVGAAKMGFAFSGDEDGYDGEETADGDLIMEAEPGHIEQVGPDFDFKAFDPAYPHEQYAPFQKQQLRRFATGLDVAYEMLSNDRADVNYSSLRAGVLDDREGFKTCQNWFIRNVTKRQFGKFASLNFMGAGDPAKALYQGRRWSWVDPEKDLKAVALSIKHGLISPSDVIREQGRDPETVFRQIAKDKETLQELGLWDDLIYGGNSNR